MAGYSPPVYYPSHPCSRAQSHAPGLSPMLQGSVSVSVSRSQYPDLSIQISVSSIQYPVFSIQEYIARVQEYIARVREYIARAQPLTLWSKRHFPTVNRLSTSAYCSWPFVHEPAGPWGNGYTFLRSQESPYFHDLYIIPKVYMHRVPDMLQPEPGLPHACQLPHPSALS